MVMARPRIEIVVDELVLVGADPRDARRIGAAIERAAAERLAAATPPAPGRAQGSIDRIDGGEFRIGGRRDAAGYGQGVAAAIARSVARTV
jgi:hypothetical protein